MKTKTITLYKYGELTQKSQQKALENWNQYNDDPFMQSHMINLLKEELDERGVKYDTDSMDVRYSLSYSQGDGFMFMGKVIWRDKEILITQNNYRYCHEKTARFTNEDETLTAEEIGQFIVVYEAVCKKMERAGYDHIEYHTSEEAFEQACEANEYTFREDGTMENE